MIDALYIAISGMQSELTQLNTISNNLANMNTTAFKKSTVSFDDLVYRDVINSAGRMDRMGANMRVGMGSGVSSVLKDFSVGDLLATENPLDIAIRGQGFFEVNLGNGEYGFTRAGSLKVDSDGYLATVGGQRLSANIQVPPDTTNIQIAPDGVVSARINGGANPLDIGQLELVNFLNPTSLEAIGNNLYRTTEDTSGLTFSKPGNDGVGFVSQGFLEGSNVNLVTEMMNLVVTQRAYSVNSQVIRAVDEMLQINNSLRG
jgi:flagellar basal-body rod protein FlgG